MSLRAELPNGLGVRLYRARFRVTRWRGDGGVYDGRGREGDGTRWRRLRMYEWPFGVVHVLGRWDR